jgi:hypothetical protein
MTEERNRNAHPATDKEIRSKYEAILTAIKERGTEDLLLREDCPCPAHNCPHKGNCMACILYHHMLSVIRQTRMTLPACAYFSERDYWIEKRKATTNAEVKKAIDEWLDHYRILHNRRIEMTQDPEFMAFDREFEDRINAKWIETYADKTAEEREKRIARNKQKAKGVPGAYPYR